jgi:predicted permease
VTESRPRPPWAGRAILRIRRLGHRRREVEDDLQELFDARVRTKGRRHAAVRYLLDAVSLWRWKIGPPGAPEVVDIPASPRAARWNGFSRDVIFAVRMFTRQPAIVVMTVAGLSLAIGISTVILTLANAANLRTTGIREPETLSSIEVSNLGRGRLVGGYSPIRGNWAYIDFARLEAGVPSMELAADSPFTMPVEFRQSADRSLAEAIPLMPVSGNYFTVLGGRATLGRTVLPEDDAAGADRLAVVSHTLWKIRFNADPNVVGRTVWLDEVPFTVIGVAERGFVGAHGSKFQTRPAIWITFASQDAVWRARQRAANDRAAAEIARLSDRPALDAIGRMRLDALRASLASAPDRWNIPVDVVGRLRGGASPARAEAELTTMARAFAAEGRAADRPPTVHLGPAESPAAEPVLTAIIAAVVAVLLTLACANVANLLLANASGRRREIGTRLALGASRGRVVRQLLTESVLLGLCAGAAGLVLARWLAPFAARALGLPALIDLSPDFSVYLMTALLTLASGIIAGLAPARYGWRGNLLAALQCDRSGSAALPAPTRLRSVLVAGQAAACMVLLVLAALLTRSAVEAARFDTGVSIDRLINVSPSLGRGYDAARKEMYFAAVLDRIQQLPGVANAALAAVPPFHTFHASETIAGSMVNPGPESVQRNQVSANYFNALGIRVIQGRAFSAEEVRSQLPVAVISANLAHQFWGEESPIGSTLDRVWGASGQREGRGHLRRPAGTRIVGVVADTMTQIDDHGVPTIYLPLDIAGMVVHIVVASRGDLRSLSAEIRREVLAIDSDQTPFIALPGDRLRKRLQAARALADATSAIGASALALAVIGLFGVTAFIVGQRRREISIRMALGASGRNVVLMLVRDSLRPVAIGLCFGLAIAFIGGQLMKKMLLGISGHDPLAIASAVAMLAATATLAAFVPARRAARVDPAEMLKQD